jgi:predicted metalloprotease with PDZ domain
MMPHPAFSTRLPGRATMEVRRFFTACLLLCLIAVPSLSGQTRAAAGVPSGRITITVSMEQPSTHYFHVQFRIEEPRNDTIDVKMPSWTPGYYQIMDYARNVLNFRAEDDAGRPIPWEKTAKNSWRLRTGKATAATVNYDVYAFNSSEVDSYLDDERAFICPAGVFMHVGGRLQEPVTVVVKPYSGWREVSTGLDPVEGQRNTFAAKDFDDLYDCPILLGNQEVIRFEVRGIPHVLAGNNMGNLDRAKFVADLSRMIESAATLMGDIPYTHYTFMIIGPAQGGLEHRNSTALTAPSYTLDTREGYVRWLTFVTHEYFHLYNVKRIRPIALGPFDYDHENYTRMLWVSEGITVYYEDIILNRAGLLTRSEVLERAGRNIARYENVPGHLFQSATESSFDTWIKFFNREPNLVTTTISYYDKGAALGMLLDLAIRHESRNRRSLDDVMRTLYLQFYREKQRGFTDAEFREVCEKAAGVPLPEIFDVYASTVREVDYAKYLAYAGLDLSALPGGGVSWGVATEEKGGLTVVSSVEWDSPAARAGISVQDEVLAVDKVRVTSQSIGETLNLHKPGDRIKVLVSRRGNVKELEVTLGASTRRAFKITVAPDPTPLQSATLAAWLK